MVVLMIMVIAVFLVYVVGILYFNYIKSFCFMCSPVKHYFCSYLIFFLYEFDAGKIVFGLVPNKNDVVSQEGWSVIFIILVPSKNDNRCPRKSGLSSLHYCLLCLHLSRIRCLSFLLKLSRMATLFGKSYSFCSSSVLSEKCYVFYVFSFPPGVCVGTLNLIASIPGLVPLFLLIDVTLMRRNI